MKEFSILALGGNTQSKVGSPKETLRQAILMLSDHGVRVEKTSKFYQTPAFPAGSGADYVNAAALVSANHSAVELLDILHEIEAELGRERLSRWASRPMDIDLIAMGQKVAPDREGFAKWRDLTLEDQKTLWPDQLILPHPRLQDRAFVLVPMADVAPDWVHPVSGKTVQEMLDALPQALKNEVVAL